MMLCHQDIVQEVDAKDNGPSVDEDRRVKIVNFLVNLLLCEPC
jgi:hypothetical protein